jgi:hypothetical protein
MINYPKPSHRSHRQAMPGSTAKMDPRPGPEETSYKGSGRLQGKRATITGGESGIGRAVAIAFACEDADILIADLDESKNEVAALTQKGGSRLSWSMATFARPTIAVLSSTARRGSLAASPSSRAIGRECKVA